MESKWNRAYELTLVLRSQNGDEHAFEELLRLHSAGLRCYVTQMLRDLSASSDDVLQEVWLSVHRSLPKLRDPAAFPAWLYEIARARIHREFRRRHIELQPTNDVPEQEAVADSADEAFDPGQVHAAMSRLSPEHREVLVLRFLRDLTYEEIAHVTNQSLGTVRSRLHYAKRAMQRVLKQEIP